MISTVRRSRLAWTWLLLAIGVSACHRAVRTDLGPERQVDSGVPQTFGSDAGDASELTFDFGDGTAPVKGRKVEHAFDRAGEYVVRALDGSSEVSRVRITVIPRSVLKAIPAEFQAAVCGIL